MSGKKYTVPAGRLGYATKTKDGKNTMIHVEQDMTLKAGQVLFLHKRADILARAEAAGVS